MDHEVTVELLMMVVKLTSWVSEYEEDEHDADAYEHAMLEVIQRMGRAWEAWVALI